MSKIREALKLAHEELKRIGDIEKRFARDDFPELDDWANWVQSRARHVARQIDDTLKESGND